VSVGGCERRKRPKKEPKPEPAASSAPRPVYADRPHHWIYYPDEPIDFCDRRQHHWVHVEELADRPNDSAAILANQKESEIHRRRAEHAEQYPPGWRR